MIRSKFIPAISCLLFTATAYAANPVLLAQADTMADGVVKRINKGAKKLTIKHGEIKSLEMPPMTMVFRVAEDAMLDAVKKGDKVKFQVIDRDGKMIITEIKPAE